jgi:hypothetical protein
MFFNVVAWGMSWVNVRAVLPEVGAGQLGAYGSAMRTGFNGFGTGETVIVSDAPMASLIPAGGAPSVPQNVVPLGIAARS